MPTQLEKAREYLDVLEAERLAALALSEQKAEEAKLIKARLEGFQAAMEMLGARANKCSIQRLARKAKRPNRPKGCPRKK